MRRLLRAVAWLCAAAALALILRTCVFGLVKVAGQSMENTLETGDVALVSRLDYRLGSIRRGDVAQIRVPGRDGTYLKRVVGLPGERWSFRAARCSSTDSPWRSPTPAILRRNFPSNWEKMSTSCWGTIVPSAMTAGRRTLAR